MLRYLRRRLGDVVVVAAGVGLGVWSRRRHHHGVVPEARDRFALGLLAIERLGELAQRVRKRPHVGSRVGRATGGALDSGAVLAARASGPLTRSQYSYDMPEAALTALMRWE